MTWFILCSHVYYCEMIAKTLMVAMPQLLIGRTNKNSLLPQHCSEGKTTVMLSSFWAPKFGSQSSHPNSLLQVPWGWLGASIAQCHFASHKSDVWWFFCFVTYFVFGLQGRLSAYTKNTVQGEIWTLGPSGSIFIYLNSQEQIALSSWFLKYEMNPLGVQQFSYVKGMYL